MVTKINWYNNKAILEWLWASDNEMIARPHWTSCYLIDGVLIDSGPPGGVKEFRELIISLGLENVMMCVLTHSHEDHIGGAHILQEEFEIPIYASRETIPIIKEGYTYPEYRQIVWGTEIHPVDAEPAPNPIYSKTGNYCFDLLPIPGHAPDQISLIEREKQWAFVADGVIPKYKRIFGTTSSIKEDISQIYQSIQSLYKFTNGMENLQIFSSGRGVFFGREYFLERMQEIMNLRMKVHELSEQGSSVEDITLNIFPGEDIFGILTNGELASRNLIQSLLEWKV
ncbi:MAG: MBL fold metallo-hydrolase [Candidatus Hodarchaeota archaeon]